MVFWRVFKVLGTFSPLTPVPPPLTPPHIAHRSPHSFGTHLERAKLKFLDLSFNGSIEDAKQECDALITGLWANKTLRTFEFNGNDITSSSLRKMVARAVLGFDHCFDAVQHLSEEEMRSEGVTALRQTYDRLEGKVKGTGQEERRKESAPSSFFTQAFLLSAAEVCLPKVLQVTCPSVLSHTPGTYRSSGSQSPRARMWQLS